MTKRLLAMLAFVALGGAVFAQALPDQSTLTITDSSGALVGSGTYQGGALTLALASTFSGSGILTVTTRGGDTLIYAVNVSDKGAVTLEGSGTPLQDLNPSIQNRGGTVDIHQVTTALTTPSLPDHPAPDAHANANASEGAANATEGDGNAAPAAANGLSHASDHAGKGSGNADQGSGGAASGSQDSGSRSGAGAGSGNAP